jgi:hypothetical protein
MKRIISFFFLLIPIMPLQAQNLVPNGDFEEYFGCPSMVGQIDSCKYWTHPANLVAGADYFNRCSTFIGVDVPINKNGIQEPRSGDAYCGMAIYDPYSIIDYREYIKYH